MIRAMTSPSQHVMRQEQNVQLAEALEQLPADYREVIVLRHLEGLSHEEVAQRMGRTPGAIRMLWMRGFGRTEETVCRGQFCLCRVDPRELFLAAFPLLPNPALLSGEYANVEMGLANTWVMG